MHTTTISKLPISSISNSHNTRGQTYEFDIDFIGSGADTFAGPISKKHAYRFKDRDQAGLNELVSLYVAHGTPQGLISEIPVWAWQGAWTFYQGIDISRRFELTVRDADGKPLYDNNARQHGHTDLASEHAMKVYASEFSGTAPYLYAKDVFPIHVRYSITSDKPFDPTLIALQCEDVHGTRFINEFEYDGQDIEPKLMFWPYADTDHRIVKILLN